MALPSLNEQSRELLGFVCKVPGDKWMVYEHEDDGRKYFAKYYYLLVKKASCKRKSDDAGDQRFDCICFGAPKRGLANTVFTEVYSKLKPYSTRGTVEEMRNFEGVPNSIWMLSGDLDDGLDGTGEEKLNQEEDDIERPQEQVPAAGGLPALPDLRHRQNAPVPAQNLPQLPAQDVPQLPAPPPTLSWPVTKEMKKHYKLTSPQNSSSPVWQIFQLIQQNLPDRREGRVAGSTDCSLSCLCSKWKP
jgi:hypothetical protein